MKEKHVAKVGDNRRMLYYVSFLVLCFALLLLATFRDLQINRFLNNPDSNFGEMLADVGETPVYCVIPFASMVLFAALEKKNKAYIFKKIGLAFFNFVGWAVFFVAHLGPNLFGDVKKRNSTFFYALFALISVVCCILSLYFALRVPKKTMQTLKPFAIFLLLAVLCTAITTELTKNVVGRIRYRDLAKNGGEDAYTKWFIINGFGTGNKSFPSGHTSAAASLMSLMALPDVMRNLKKYEIDLFALGAIYTLLVGLSRMIVGAHYLSDIIVGALIGFCSLVLFRRLYLDKKVAKNECEPQKAD